MGVLGRVPFEVRVVILSTMDTHRSSSKNELYKQPPPPFGHALLKYYALDPGYINLNNGVVPSVL